MGKFELEWWDTCHYPIFLTSEFLYKLNVLILNYMEKQYFLEFHFILKIYVRKTAVKIKLDPS